MGLFAARKVVVAIAWRLRSWAVGYTGEPASQRDRELKIRARRVAALDPDLAAMQLHCLSTRLRLWDRLVTARRNLTKAVAKAPGWHFYVR